MIVPRRLSILGLAVAAIALSGTAPLRALSPEQGQPPAGTLIDHPCTNCAVAVAATDDAVWAGTYNAGVVRWGTGRPARCGGSRGRTV